MKKLSVSFFLCVLLFTLSACGIPAEDYQSAVNERDSAISERDNLSSKVNSLQDEKEELEEEISTLKSVSQEKDEKIKELEDKINSLQSEIEKIEKEIELLLTYKEEAAPVVAEIDALDGFTIMTERIEAIISARQNYDALSKGAQNMVANYKKLSDAQAEIALLRDEKEQGLIDATENDTTQEIVSTKKLIEGDVNITLVNNLPFVVREYSGSDVDKTCTITKVYTKKDSAGELVIYWDGIRNEDVFPAELPVQYWIGWTLYDSARTGWSESGSVMLGIRFGNSPTDIVGTIEGENFGETRICSLSYLDLSPGNYYLLLRAPNEFPDLPLQ